jgi:hypothetical protein
MRCNRTREVLAVDGRRAAGALFSDGSPAIFRIANAEGSEPHSFAAGSAHLGVIFEHPPAALTVVLSFGQIGGCFSAISKKLPNRGQDFSIREKFGFPPQGHVQVHFLP